MERHDDVIKHTVLKEQSPFKLGVRTMRIDGGRERMIQTRTTWNFASVEVGMDMSIPLTMSP